MALLDSTVKGLTCKLSTFQKCFDVTKVEKCLALEFARQLKDLSDHIYKCYNCSSGKATKRLDPRLDLWNADDYSRNEEQHKGIEELNNSNFSQEVSQKRRRESEEEYHSSSDYSQASEESHHSSEDYGSDSSDENKEDEKENEKLQEPGVSYGENQRQERGAVESHFIKETVQEKEELFQILCEETNRKRKRELEGDEIVRSRIKTPSRHSCGVSYIGASADKEFSDGVKKKIQNEMPVLKHNKDIFRFMAFASLDRLYCSRCSDCPNKPSILDQWIKPGGDNRENIEPIRLGGNPAMPQLGIPRMHSLPIDIRAMRNADSTRALNHRNVLTAIDSITEWEMLGIALGLSSDVLRTIQKDGNDVFDCKTKLIDSWLQQMDDVSEPTWHSLVSAIGGPIMKKKSLAQKISKEWIN